MSAYPRVSVGFVLTVVERDIDKYVGQVIMAVGADQERVIWESRQARTPTLAYQLAEDRVASMITR